jgi:NarL family two-component system sensor histidine kinase YdfH
LEAHLEQENIVKVAEIAAQAKTRARTTLAEARQAIGDLRQEPAAGTVEAIAREVERFRRATGIPCDLTLPEILALSDELGEHVVRCVSEGLTNVMQHARATAVSVKLGVVNGRYQLTIHDNGQGFDPAKIPTGHYGLIGLRERARLASGTLTIDSQPGQGTTLTLTIPVQHEK